ncbi:hypothetical protein CesoFtcFv8_009142 [Champsocephalus esox]|uniref:Uncharacterized protein n=1 Tax=Champsocephalus esox TaxID=159716 RepID=A0AAN8C9Z7_9TELE|nr:hypothetical protein CesoFtcFv8_009142 [Champsocephalus esox]
MQSQSLLYPQSNNVVQETAGWFPVENNMLERQTEAEALQPLWEETHFIIMKEALEMERQSLTSERETFQRECAEERNAFQLEKERERFNKELREQLMAFQAENSAMSDDRKSFKIDKAEMAMMRKAYIREKTGIQRSRVAIGEREHGKRKKGHQKRRHV